MNLLGRSELDIERILKNRDSERIGVNDTQYLKKLGSSYNTYNSNGTNYNGRTDSSQSKRHITSILNNTPGMYKLSTDKMSNARNDFESEDDIISLEGQSMSRVKPDILGLVNRSCMNLQKNFKKMSLKDNELVEKKFKKKDRLLTNSMIVSNFIERPKKINDFKFPDYVPKVNRGSLISQNSMKFNRSSIKKSPDSSFRISKRILNPVQNHGESILKVNLSKIPSDTG